MTVIYRENEANPRALDGCQVAVLGYGNLGRPLALNLRDSGLKLIVGSNDEPSTIQARADGFEVLEISQAASVADVKLMMFPDEAMPDIYLRFVFPTLRPDRKSTRLNSSHSQ